MFDIGFAELLVIGVVALLVLGPEKLPLAAKTCGLWLGRIRRSVNNIQREINEELRVEELRRTTAMEKEKLDEELAEMRKPFAYNESDTTTSSNATQQAAPQADKTGDEAGQANSVKKSATDD
ncbi:Sec-independent protein translocase protein TatB [Marinobacterium lutimaris]|uniref:Sec-independent protein translocase protein TatB n=1 Tax=Marinobacterium lutimaris TaxID=568106 RepID=A0A1H6DEH4_9GAMM|nr:Sec-independent protein translocase protein TatB [Marinobacterium lutimaris]SEG83624.1 sec-independent protein translocase protein TatB [Marinobacterium lutimaris]